MKRANSESAQSKLQRAFAQRTTRVSVALISQVALELSRLPDGTISKQHFHENFTYAFTLLTQTDKQLLSSLEPDSVSEVSKIN